MCLLPNVALHLTKRPMHHQRVWLRAGRFAGELWRSAAWLSWPDERWPAGAWRPGAVCAIGVLWGVLHFVETPVFSRLVAAVLGPAEYRALQLALLLRPEAGAIIAGTHGLRKLRWAPAGRGKRGGVRVIYYWAPDPATIYLLYIYAKNEQGDLTPAQAKALARLVQEEFG